MITAAATRKTITTKIIILVLFLRLDHHLLMLDIHVIVSLDLSGVSLVVLAIFKDEKI